MIRFTCSCGEQFQVADDLAGRPVRCPACNVMQTAPGSITVAPAGSGAGIRLEPAGQFPESPQEGGGAVSCPDVVTSRKAAWSLGLGIGSFLCNVFAGIPAIILGLLALGDIARSHGRTGGRGLALGGIATGSLGIVFGPALAIGLFLFEASKVRQSMRNLSQIGLAMHNCHDTLFGFPMAGGGNGMHPGLSWRVSLLPFLGESGLYKQFKLDEPWDGVNNKKLLERMPAVYAFPAGRDAPGMTRYRVFVGRHAAFDLSQPGKGLRRGRTIAAFTDGLSNTILVVEAAEPVPWTKPDELEYDPTKPLPRLSTTLGGCAILMGDASVHFLPASTPEADVRAMITPNGGEPVGPPASRRFESVPQRK
jgi:hypothetical protein